VNLITVAPAFKQQVEVVIRERCPFVFFAGSIPSGRDIAEVKAAGLKVICFARSSRWPGASSSRGSTPS